MLKTINASSVLSTFNLFSILQALILNLFYVKKKKGRGNSTTRSYDTNSLMFLSVDSCI